MEKALAPRQIYKIPPLIKKNTALFAIAHTFSGAGMQFAYGLGPLMVMMLTGSASLAGLSVGLIGLSRFLISYPIGKVTDNFGRKPGILLGLSVAIVGALVLGFAMHIKSVIAFTAGLLVFGMGMNAAHQLRVAATDMFPPTHRAQALGYLALGTLGGLLISPVMIAISDRFSAQAGVDALALPWFMLPLLIIPGMMIIRFVHPDPKEIGMNLKRYYPDYEPPKVSDVGRGERFRAVNLLKVQPTRLAIAANSAAQGNMSMMMVLTSLVLSHHGHSLTAIGFSHMFHTAGMFAFTIPLGMLSDRFGREKVMYPGVAMALVGALLVTFTAQYWLITLGTFLVGLGWAAANVAATALIADHAETAERGRAIGVNDSFAGGMSVFSALITGPLIAYWGLPAAGLAAVVLAAIPILMFVFSRRPAGASG